MLSYQHEDALWCSYISKVFLWFYCFLCVGVREWVDSTLIDSLNFQWIRHYFFFFFPVSTAPNVQGPFHYRDFTITLKHTTLSRAGLGELSSRRRDLYLTTHNTQERDTSTPPAGFKPAIPASERPQTHTLSRAATGIDRFILQGLKINGHVFCTNWLGIGSVFKKFSILPEKE
jgi:hypothetical protein